MPLLGALLVNLFGSAFAYLASRAGEKAAVVLAVTASLVAAVAALMLVFNNAVAPMIDGMFNTSYGQFIGLAFPPVAGTCLAAISTTWVACSTYRLVVNITRAGASA